MEVHCQMDEQAENIYLEYFEFVLTEMGLQSPSKEDEAFHLFQQLMSIQD